MLTSLKKKCYISTRKKSAKRRNSFFTQAVTQTKKNQRKKAGASIIGKNMESTSADERLNIMLPGKGVSACEFCESWPEKNLGLVPNAAVWPSPHEWFRLPGRRFSFSFSSLFSHWFSSNETFCSSVRRYVLLFLVVRRWLLLVSFKASILSYEFVAEFARILWDFRNRINYHICNVI